MSNKKLNLLQEIIIDVKTTMYNSGAFLVDAYQEGELFIEEYSTKTGKVTTVIYGDNLSNSKKYKNLKIKQHLKSRVKFNTDKLKYTNYPFSIEIRNCKTEEQFKIIMTKFIDNYCDGNIYNLFTEKTLSILTNALIGVTYSESQLTFHCKHFTYSVFAYKCPFELVKEYKANLIKLAI